MSKFIQLFIVVSAVSLFISCNQKVAKINKADYNQQEFNWTIESSSKAVWSGEQITSTKGSENPEDYDINLESKGNEQVKLTIDEKAVSEEMWNSMPNKALRYNIKSNLSSGNKFVNDKRMRSIFQSNPPEDKFGVSSTFAVNCDEYSDQMKKIIYQILAESNLIKEYEFESQGFEKAVKYIACQ